ncbi:MAG: hypothetical protein ABSH48_03610 [Verrucomicrobiota bacterium]
MNFRISLLLATFLLLKPGAQALTWRWSNPQPNGNNITGLAQNGDLSVEVAELGQVYLGNDFYDWAPCAVPTTNDLQAVTFFGNRLVAVGENGMVIYSDDYVNFTNVALNSSPNWLIAVAASSNRLVTVGDNAILYSSTNGADWTAQAKPPNVGSDWLVSAAYGNGTFVIGGDNGYIATSTNGTSWSSHIIGTSDSIFWLSHVAGSGSPTNFPYAGFWAVSDAGHAWYSTNNGAKWKQFSVAESTNIFYSLSADEWTGLLVGNEAVELGTNAAGWTPQTGSSATNAPIWTYYDSLCQANGIYQLAGAGGMLVQGTKTGSSYDWSVQYPNNFYDWLLQVIAVDGLYVAVGDHARVATSDDGANWTVEALPRTNSISTTNTIFLCVGGDTNLIVAAGNQGSLAVSPQTFVPIVQTNADGTLVTNLANTIGVIWNSLPAPTTSDLTAVGVYSNLYYLAGSSGTLFASADGTHWIRYHVPVTNDLAGIAASTNQMVVVGDNGCIITSANGTNWTQRSSGTSSGLFRVHWINGIFLAFGENGTILRSTNAAEWYADDSGTTNWLNDAITVSNTCYVVGNYGTVLGSTNLVNWARIPTTTPLSLYGAATQNGQLLVVGLNGTILRSPITPSTNAITFLAYAQANNENVFLISGGLDEECTLDSATNLLGNWTTGPLLDFLYGDGTLEVIQSLGSDPPISQSYRCTVLP